MVETEVTISFSSHHHISTIINRFITITNTMKIISTSMVISIIMQVMVSEDISTEVQQIEPRCLSYSINLYADEQYADADL